MSKVLAIDYGGKRSGIAITDSLKMIASPHTTIATKEIHDYLKEIIGKEDIDTIVIGEAKRFSGEASAIEKSIEPLLGFIKKKFPAIKLVRQDESFTSKLALDAMIQGGMKKKQRQEKGNLDKISAAIILQSYLDSTSF